jgi:hypothetical protein
MRNIPDKVDGVDSLSGAEYTSHKNAPLNVIIASDQTPTSSDSYQLAKAVSMAAANGNYFTDTGVSSAANYIHLLPRTGNVPPPKYEPGMQVRFMPAYSNNSSTVQLKVSSFLAKYVSFKRATNPVTYPPYCPMGTLDTDKWYTATYLLHPNGINYYWSLDAIEGADIGDLAITDRELASDCVTTPKIANEAVTNANLADNIQLDKISGGTLDIGDLELDGTSARYGASPKYTQMSENGITYGGTTYGDATVPSLRWFTFYISAAGGDWSNVSDSYYLTTKEVDTNIPFNAGTPPLSVNVTYTYSGNLYSASATCRFEDNGGDITISSIRVPYSMNGSITSGTNFRIHFAMSGSNLA